MARKKKHEEHVNHERWLVSYADFITLLFATFTALFAISNADKEKFADMARSLRNAFSTSIETNIQTIHLNGTGISDNNNMGIYDVMRNAGSRSVSTSMIQAASTAGAHSKPSPVAVNDQVADPDYVPPDNPSPGMGSFADGGENASAASGSGLSAAEKSQVNTRIPRLSNKLAGMLDQARLTQSTTIRRDSRGLVISLGEEAFFDEESAFVKTGSVYKLNKIIEMLREGGYSIRIEGHTDNAPLRRGTFDSHLELSALRASKLAAYMRARFDFPAGAISAAGYGSDWPIADNSTSAGRRKNRRVDLVIIMPEDESAAL